MDLLTALLIGVAATVLATFFPGMLNMTAVSTSLRVNRRAGYEFSAGLTAMLTLQAGLAMFFANFLALHPAILQGMKEWAVAIFAVLAVFFLVKGYRLYRQAGEPEDRPYHGSPFWRGVGMALANFLTLPYYFAAGGWVLAHGYLSDHPLDRVLFTVGAGTGAVIVFGAYVRLAEWIKDHAHFVTRNINFIIGALFVLLAIIQSYRLLR